MSTWRDFIHAKVAQIIADAKVRGLDAKATKKALRNPYASSGPRWQCQVWYDEVSRQLGKSTGRIRRSTSPLAIRDRAVEAGQLDLLGGRE